MHSSSATNDFAGPAPRIVAETFVTAETERGAMSAKPVPSDAEALASAIAGLPSQRRGSCRVTLPTSVPPPGPSRRLGALREVADNWGHYDRLGLLANPRAGDLTHDEAGRIASGPAITPNSEAFSCDVEPDQGGGDLFVHFSAVQRAETAPCSAHRPRRAPPPRRWPLPLALGIQQHRC
jgi:hypothetical protein